MRSVERARDRRELVRDAGLSAVSTISVLAGVLVAYGAVLLLLAVVTGVGSAVGFETEGISENEWQDIGIGAVVAIGFVLLVSYFFGGYVAGRMGRRSGLGHGVLVFVLGLVVVALAAGATALADSDTITDELRNQGIPTDVDDWREIGLFGGLGVLAAMLVGAVLGGIRGERWHGRLVTRALDPQVRPRGAAGPEAGVGSSRQAAGDDAPDLARHGDAAGDERTLDLEQREQTRITRRE